jgi:hypothetical protein
MAPFLTLFLLLYISAGRYSGRRRRRARCLHMYRLHLPWHFQLPQRACRHQSIKLQLLDDLPPYHRSDCNLVSLPLSC